MKTGPQAVGGMIRGMTAPSKSQPGQCTDCRNPAPAPGRILCNHCAAHLRNPPPKPKEKARGRQERLREA